jgi:hypothetical protein
MTLIYPILFFMVCWYAFAMCVSVYRRWVDGKLSPFNKLMFVAPLLLFILLDVVGNYTLLLAFGWPPKDCYTISKRMGFYRMNDGGVRRWCADVLCSLLSELDPTGVHC